MDGTERGLDGGEGMMSVVVVGREERGRAYATRSVRLLTYFECLEVRLALGRS